MVDKRVLLSVGSIPIPSLFTMEIIVYNKGKLLIFKVLIGRKKEIMYEFKELILPEHFRHASYGGFCVKPGMFYGVEKETGKLVATTGWNVNGLTNIYIQHEPKIQWNNDLWEDLYDDYGKPLITIEENDLQRISDKVKDFQKTAMDFETWADENGYNEEYCEDLTREELDQIEESYEWYYFMGYPEFVIQLLKEHWDLENYEE